MCGNGPEVERSLTLSGCTSCRSWTRTWSVLDPTLTLSNAEEEVYIAQPADKYSRSDVSPLLLHFPSVLLPFTPPSLRNPKVHFCPQKQGWRKEARRKDWQETGSLTPTRRRQLRNDRRDGSSQQPIQSSQLFWLLGSTRALCGAYHVYDCTRADEYPHE